MSAAFASAGAAGALHAPDPIRDTIIAVEGRLARMPSPRSPAAMSLHHRMADELVVDIWRLYGGRVTIRADLARITLHGITATSTQGVVGAARNWIAAARRKLEDGA